MYFYHIVSGVKIVLGTVIMLLVYNFVNVYEDPIIWIGLGFLWLFIATWWVSFFLFLWWQNLFRRVKQLRIIKDSYKLSLLFGIYAMINVLLLLMWQWTKLLWLLLLLGFIMLQVILFVDSGRVGDD